MCKCVLRARLLARTRTRACVRATVCVCVCVRVCVRARAFACLQGIWTGGARVTPARRWGVASAAEARVGDDEVVRAQHVERLLQVYGGIQGVAASFS